MATLIPAYNNAPVATFAVPANWRSNWVAEYSGPRENPASDWGWTRDALSGFTEKLSNGWFQNYDLQGNKIGEPHPGGTDTMAWMDTLGPMLVLGVAAAGSAGLFGSATGTASAVEAATAPASWGATNLYAGDAAAAGYTGIGAGAIADSTAYGLTAAEVSMVDSIAAGASPIATSLPSSTWTSVASQAGTAATSAAGSGALGQIVNGIKQLIAPSNQPGQAMPGQAVQTTTPNTNWALLAAVGLAVFGALG